VPAYVPFESIDRTTLRWLRSGDQPPVFHLKAGDALVAELRWEKDPGSPATAESASGSWILQRGGFLNPHVTARSSTGGRETARLSVHLGYHLIHFGDGSSYRFHRAGLLVPAWQVTTEDRREILHLEPVRKGRLLEAGAVLVDPAAKDLPSLLLLVVLTWHFIVLAWFEDEALVPLEGRDLPP
jgi:hypothetical protein